MDAFLEERLPVGVRYGASWFDDYAVTITQTAGGQEYRALTHPFPVRRFSVSYVRDRGQLETELLALYHRAHGRYAGFRVRAHDDYSTNGGTGAPTAFDQSLALVSAGVYQLQKAYGAGATPLDIGYPVRTIFKPVVGTTRVGIRNSLSGDHTVTAWTIDTTTGRVTFATNKTAVVTAITKGLTTVIGCGAHPFLAGDSVHLSGVAGMTQINGRRATVLAKDATTITLDINSSAYSDWTSGGTINTRPQAGETVMGGCEFDIPCRFDSAIDIRPVAKEWRETGEIDIVELVTP
jgi:uncharacterized protein (TIGR02217 family)